MTQAQPAPPLSDEELADALDEAAQRVLDTIYKKPGTRALITQPRAPRDVDMLMAEASNRLRLRAPVEGASSLGEADVAGLPERLEDEAHRIRSALRAEDRKRDLFRTGAFILHSGSHADWIIDAEALTDTDLATLAKVAARVVGPFGEVEGVPRGGLRFAAALSKYTTVGPLLIADDTLTTGTSMEEQRAGRDAKGIAIFARGECPRWVTAMFTLCGNWEGGNG